MDELTPLSVAERALAVAKTPEESRQVEALAKAAEAWAKEQDDFEKVIVAWDLYVKARRKTAELIEPQIRHGGDRGNNQYGEWQVDDSVHLADFNLTQKQWYRRRKELGVSPSEVDEYIDDCIEKSIEPTISGLLKKYSQIIGDTTGDEWYTPKKYIDSARTVMGGIDLDPASCAAANVVVGATTYYAEEDNGLLKPWSGRVFMNPPYSANKEFNEKLQEEHANGNIDQAVVLVGAHGIETQWFRSYWDHTLCFTGHRIVFDTPVGQQKAGNISGSVFIYLGTDPHKFAGEFGQHGYVVRRWP